ncbi:TetR/AcrR family transcriptional regulator [Nonomuraea rhizosphaerae]|uniref:TetR/AcrR family transcriptional regulator n=1 Tax=Nonomuraea rhizosphaerae TaxID=2665663 RepID=UPI001C5FEE56|nr:TetR/AcrR family transcriptional regulator [Nonomuraea rhizosphaerae]
MPKLWNETIEAHRQQVEEAILRHTSALVAEHGLRAVTMSRIAEVTGIGRATLYKYFSDVESILLVWHERQITTHLDHLAHVRDQTGDPAAALHAVLEAYAHITQQSRRHGDSAPVAFMHRDDHVADARRRLHELVRDLLTDGVRAGAVRDDVPAEELAGYCLHAVAAAGELPSKAAIRRLVQVIQSGLRPPA